MTIRPISLIAACWLAAAAAGAWAQAPAPSAAPSAATTKPAPANNKAASTVAKPGPANAKAASAPAPAIVVKPAASAPAQPRRQTRPLTAAEKRESVAPPGELRPERTITPQLTIPLGKTPPDSIRQPSRTSGGGAVNDSAGRCAAIADENERAMCRESAGLGKPKK